MWCPAFITTLTFIISINAEIFNFRDDTSNNNVNYNKNDPFYLVVAPKIIRPGHVYKVAVTLLKMDYSTIYVRTFISRNGVQIISDIIKITEPQITYSLLMKIPENSAAGDYRLRVDGGLSSKGGSLFVRESILQFSQRSLTIVIQTNKAIYNWRHMVRARIVMLTTELKPFSDPVDIFIVEPQGYIARRWMSHQSGLGVVSINFKVPVEPSKGWWKIRVVAQGQVVEESIWVQKNFAPYFVVNVNAPAFVLSSEEYIQGTVNVNFTRTHGPVYGNITMYAKIRTHQKYGQRKERIVVETPKRTIEQFNGLYNFKFPLSELRSLVYPLDGSEVEIRVKAIHYFTNNTHEGFVKVKIINETLHFRFLGTAPQSFKPGMPFQTNLAISYHDQVSLNSERLSTSTFTVVPTIKLQSGWKQLETISGVFPESGVFQINIRVPKDASRIDFKASYRDLLDNVNTELTVVASHSPKNKYIHVSTSTTDAMVGEYIVFHVRTNFFTNSFNYVVLSKGIIQLAATEPTSGGYKQIIHTFAVPVSPSMAPSTTLIVYTVTRDGQVLSDSVTIPVNGIARNKVTFDINLKKDKTSKTAELFILNVPGAMAFVSAIDVDSYNGQSKNEISKYNILGEMYKFEISRDKLQTIVWRSREGSAPTRVYYTTSSYGIDTLSTFENIGLMLFTDANTTSREDPCEYYFRQQQYTDDKLIQTTAQPSFNEWIERDKLRLNYKSCASVNQCYSTLKHCDGHKDCVDGSDESNCENEERDDFESTLFHMNRRNRRPYQFDATAKDFAWHDLQIGFNVDTQMYVNIPKRLTQWKFNVFSMDSNLGFGIIDEPFVYTERRPFYMTSEAPFSAVIYEQIGITVNAFNLLNYEIEVLLELQKSDTFKSVMVGPLGAVSQYNPETTQSNIQHLVLIKPNSNRIIHMPVVAVREGKIKVVIVGRTQIGMDKVVQTIKIVSEGATQRLHTSLLLNLKNIPNQLTFLNVNLTETPIVPFEQYRRYVWGSPKGTVSVSGDVTGPAFPIFPVQPSDLHLTNLKAGESNSFDFAYHLLMLRYLLITNQWDKKFAKKVFNHLQIGYGDSIGHHQNNYYYQFSSKRPSVWLTAHATRMFQLARYPEWENFLYIDPKIIADGIALLLQYQQDDGSFYDEDEYPFDRKMAPRTVFREGKVKKENISLTAHVLLTFIKVTELSGDLRIRSITAKSKALDYLEKKLPSLNDPYEVAIVTYALNLANSVMGQKAFEKLDTMKRSDGAMIYWSRGSIPSQQRFIENQRPYILPRKKSRYDSVSVEATAYALLTYIRREGFVQDRIVEWLVTVKYSDQGFCSTRDTIVAMEALIEYSYRSRVRDVTELQVKIEATPIAGSPKIFKINQDNLSKQQSLVLPAVYGNVESLASGGGLALIQLDIAFGVDRTRTMIAPPDKSFNLDINLNFFGRNNSHLFVDACASWNLLEVSERSGFAMLEIQLPSGYFLWNNYMVAHMKKFPNVARGLIRDRQARIYFSSLGAERSCVNFTVNRWYPVANMTRFMLARVYEYFAPEHYAEKILDVYGAYVLNICQVCGSYQCPYCPYFSRAIVVSSFSLIFTVVVALLMAVLR